MVTTWSAMAGASADERVMWRAVTFSWSIISRMMARITVNRVIQWWAPCC